MSCSVKTELSRSEGCEIGNIVFSKEVVPSSEYYVYKLSEDEFTNIFKPNHAYLISIISTNEATSRGCFVESYIVSSSQYAYDMRITTVPFLYEAYGTNPGYFTSSPEIKLIGSSLNNVFTFNTDNTYLFTIYETIGR